MRRALGAVLVVMLALVSTACADQRDPEVVLAEIVERTFDEPFRFELDVEADTESLRSLGEGAGDAATFLAGLRADGTVDGEATQLRILLLGIEAIEVRRLAADELYLRTAAVQLLALASDPALGERLATRIEALGLDPAVEAASLAALAGRWIGIRGELDLGALSGLAGVAEDGEARPEPEAVESAARSAFGTDLPGFLRRFVLVEQVDDAEAGTRYDVALDLRELIRAANEMNAQLGSNNAVPLEELEADLEEVPGRVPGVIVTGEGRVQELRFDIALAAREFGLEIPGAITLRLGLSEHGTAPSVIPPEDPTIVTSEQLVAGVDRLLTLLEAVG